MGTENHRGKNLELAYFVCSYSKKKKKKKRLKERIYYEQAMLWNHDLPD
jgi:transposase